MQIVKRNTMLLKLRFYSQSIRVEIIMEHHKELKASSNIKETLKRMQIISIKQPTCGSKLWTPFQKPSCLIFAYNPFAGCGCVNDMSVQDCPSCQSHTSVEPRQSNLPAQKLNWGRLLRAMTTWVLSISKDRDTTTSVGNLCQH